MERFGKGPTLAGLLTMLAVSCAVAHAQGDDPPARSARLGLAIAQLDENWRESNSYRSSGVMVVGVDPRGRAAKSGIVAGDVLVSVGSRTMREPSDLGYAERSLSPDKPVSVVLARDRGRMIKIFEIAPVGAAPVVAVEPGAAATAPDVPPAADQAPPAKVAATTAAPDSASPQAEVDATAAVSGTAPPPAAAAPTAAASGTASPPVVLATAAPAAAPASDSSLPPATVTPLSAAPDTSPPPAAASTSALAAEQAAGPRSVASDAAPSLTAAGAAGAPVTDGTAGSPVATVGAASAPVALAAPVAIAAVPVAAAVVEPGPSPAPTTAAVDSGGPRAEGAEPAPSDLGVVGKSLTPDLATALGASGVEGILVLEVAAASPADRSGLRAGDIIVKVASQPVADMEEFQRAAAASEGPVQISTLRLGKAHVVDVALDGPPPTPVAPPSHEQLLMDLRDEVRSLRREVTSLRKKLGK